MKKTLQKAFTMVELLIVIGIIGTLSVIVIANLNPGETQRKVRDSQRVKDLTELSGAIEAFINEGNSIGAAAALRTSTGVTTCSGNWTTYDLCAYIKKVPSDPKQGVATSVITAGAANTRSNVTAANMRYRLRIDALQNYKISARLESEGNRAKLAADNGTDATATPNGSADYYEVFNNVTGAALVP